ncbi:hypothetical protein A3A71_01350 [Candidatus Berkelbacteria bacterium RIFCSPLOWO2_01_FULL_50_28]|uniref:RNA polymerase alpha subunit C-terminal domain-containing protein n=1 Tax=Candidatus Berkelbacteria bacterium RIFCSPLOWO2_01_FULL_50_28 TaxID=1797471 RepID=A0A1F5EBD7_9BACT|nr:MAG: hypothetical protein A2807_01920 [Candidatus Berkelbacteria bacterium RIFCSPHIGHO2_01_FULL_50_36]OGD64006.1 MAG: hypothetical protein A3F39_02950 [Candidatus Berkelbacteria bacterium RIFCSPHIGHO2_12_FULL_50_11]OGD64683.1 MAG: hypothetical protein A3A71_01350 [Candidatus Berkelbacteria bacterium RIFCSPLOWO2_01_FULL_50_28]
MTEVNRSVLNERRRLFMAESLSGDWAKLFEYAIHKDQSWWAEVYQSARESMTDLQQRLEAVDYLDGERLSELQVARRIGGPTSRITRLRSEVYHRIRYQLRNIVSYRMKLELAGHAGHTGSDTSIAEAGFSQRTYNCLRRANFLTLADLAKETEARLLSLRAFGKKSLIEVRNRLDAEGLAIKPG